MKTHKLLTRRQAWRFLLKCWKRPYAKCNAPYTQWGLCDSLAVLRDKEGVTSVVGKRMYRDILSVRPRGRTWFWWPIRDKHARFLAIKRILKKL